MTFADVSCPLQRSFQLGPSSDWPSLHFHSSLWPLWLTATGRLQSPLFTSQITSFPLNRPPHSKHMSTFFSSSHFPSNLIPLIFLPLLHNVVPLIILFCFHYILFSLLHPISISSSRTSPWQLLLPVYTLRIQKMTECKRTSLDLSSRPSSLSLDFFHSSFISSFHFSSCLSCNDQSATNCQNVITPVPQETPFFSSVLWHPLFWQPPTVSKNTEHTPTDSPLWSVCFITGQLKVQENYIDIQYTHFARSYVIYISNDIGDYEESNIHVVIH